MASVTLGQAFFPTQPEQKAESLGPTKGAMAVLLQELWGLQLPPVEKAARVERGAPQGWKGQLATQPQGPATPAWANWQPPPLTPSDDIEAYLATFERVAETCLWPRHEWASRLAPALRGTAAHLAFCNLGACDRNDYEKLKEAVLNAYNITMETWRQRFRQFCYPEAAGPLEVCEQLRQLCFQWLKPEKHTKERILELLVLEQFLTILPGETQNWVREQNPETCLQAATLAEGFLQKCQAAKVCKQEQQELTADLEEKKPVASRTRQNLACQEDGWRAKEVEHGLLGQGSKRLLPHRLPVSNAVTPGEKEEGSPSEESKEPEEQKRDSLARPAGSPSPGGDEEWAHALQFQLAKDLAKMLRKSDAPASHWSQDSDGSPGGKAGIPRQHERGLCSPTELLGTWDAPTEERPYQCPRCGRRFGENAALRKHLKRHLAEKRYQCTECEMRFRQSSDLIKHQRIHTGEKPYQCQECGKTFSLCSALYRHHRGHSGEKPFKCKICGKGFTRNSSLAQHHRLHKQQDM
ncbi:zinc finger and SCAN domain-containing protein 23-like [Varanus komodoensis]|uniref:zinc finger and SCAN domain-containing protein 23-like n=1 Tax=Varanus komodoensis TaxID=61221 RepID=UPI001CF7A01B|nr:zinc finger and SCAN domain-containing protein 23-like [Varanus komodoensis]